MDDHQLSLSQLEEVVGREGNPRIHVFRFKHHGVIVGTCYAVLKRRLCFLKNAKIFAILQPFPLPGKFFTTHTDDYRTGVICSVNLLHCSLHSRNLYDWLITELTSFVSRSLSQGGSVQERNMSIQHLGATLGLLCHMILVVEVCQGDRNTVYLFCTLFGYCVCWGGGVLPRGGTRRRRRRRRGNWRRWRLSCNRRSLLQLLPPPISTHPPTQTPPPPLGGQ